jgi:hypothetical protein
MSPLAVHAAYHIAHGAKSLLWTASDVMTIRAPVRLYGIDPGAASWLFRSAWLPIRWPIARWENRWRGILRARRDWQQSASQ